MDSDHDPTTAQGQYARAYDLHYGGREHALALRAYERLLAQHPGTTEAGYACAQIDQIVNQVVPAAELVAAKLALALRALEPEPAAGAAAGIGS